MLLLILSALLCGNAVVGVNGYLPPAHIMRSTGSISTSRGIAATGCAAGRSDHSVTISAVVRPAPPSSTSRRSVLAGAGAGLLGAAATAEPTLAVKDARGNQLGGLPDAPRGTVDQTPFSAVVENVRKALESVGVEGAPPPPPPPMMGPKIERDFAIGRRKGSDRLSPCPGSRACVTSSEDEGSASFVTPFVYFSQKGDALGNLLGLIFDDPQFTILRSDGNFFNGLGVYVLAERTTKDGYVYDMEFNFLPNVLESIVDVRVVERESPSGSVNAIAGGEGGGGGGGGGGSGTVRARSVLSDVAARMKWVPLDEASKRSPDEWKRRIVAENIDPESKEITQAADVSENCC